MKVEEPRVPEDSVTMEEAEGAAVPPDGDCPAQAWLHAASITGKLGADPSHKNLFLELAHPNGERGVLLANKTPFPEDTEVLKEIIAQARLTELVKNDIYGNYTVQIPAEYNTLSCSLIYPATDKVIAKYRQEEKYIVHETAEDYETITKEWLGQHQLELTWVYNFLEKKKEAERIVYEDPDKHNGFILAPDLKWNGVDVENLYLLAVVHRHGIKSVRDLTANDLPLLENVRDKGLAAIREKYNVRPDQIRIYFHYQPSFYHLHLHFVILTYDAPASGVTAAILLSDVIENLKIAGDYYKRATLCFTRKKNDKLLEMFRKAGRATEAPKGVCLTRGKRASDRSDAWLGCFAPPPGAKQESGGKAHPIAFIVSQQGWEMRFAVSAASLACRSLRSFVVAPTKTTTLFVAQSRTTGMKIIRRAFSSGQPVVCSMESDDEFQEHFLNSPTPVLVDFYADWCGPCKTLGPRLEEKVASRGGAVLMAKINVDDAGEVAADH